MNVVLRRDDGMMGNWVFLLLAIRKIGSSYQVSSKKVQPTGVLLESWFDQDVCGTEKEAIRRLRNLAKMKVRKKGYKQIQLADLPKPIVPHLTVPPNMNVTPEEMLMIISEARRERYFTLSNVSGLEESFDEGVEFVGYDTDDQVAVKVFDRFGSLQDVLRVRVATMVPTEIAIEAGYKEPVPNG